MGLREKINDNKKVSTIGAIVLTAACVVFVIVNLSSGGGSGVAEKAFFTTDDGKTLFTDPITKLPPFDRDGQQAVRAHVYTCDDGKTKFVAYLQRYTPEARQKLSDAIAKNQSTDRLIGPADIEFKKPGDKAWVSTKNPAQAATVRTVKCPEGMTGSPMPVDPE